VLKKNKKNTNTNTHTHTHTKNKKNKNKKKKTTYVPGLSFFLSLSLECKILFLGGVSVL